MGLTAKEKKALEALQRKAEEPDPPAIGRSATFNIDLGDKEQVSLAQRLGLIPGDDDADDDADEDGSDDEGDETPKRRGYFKE